jgi:hypothetical protein
MWRGRENNRKRWHTCQSPAMTGQMDEMMLHIRLIIHPSRHGLFTPTERRKSGIHILHIVKDVVKPIGRDGTHAKALQ